MRSAGSKVVAFTRALVLLAFIAIGVPLVLIGVARARFGGAAPFHGVPSPADWEADRIRAALTERLSDDTIADVVIRLALVVAWVAVVVIVVTVVAEVVHMVRHRGVALPAIRGLGLTQSVARVIAAGLLVIVPLTTTPSRTVALGGPSSSGPVATTTAADGPQNVWPGRTPHAPGVVGAVDHAHVVDARAAQAADGADRLGVPSSPLDAPAGPAGDPLASPSVAEGAEARQRYVVVSGDSIYGIAQRHAGPDPVAVAAFADELIDLNLGREMADGQRFTNAAYIDVGWVLTLPERSTSVESHRVGEVDGRDGAGEADGVHVVEPGESLWQIAGDELGDPERWPEIYERNEGRTFDDGRALTDPDLIHPGWQLDVDVDGDVEGVESGIDEVVLDEASDDEVSATADEVPDADEPAVAPARELPPPDPGDAPSIDRIDHDRSSGPINVWPERDTSGSTAEMVSTSATSAVGGGATTPPADPSERRSGDGVPGDPIDGGHREAAGLVTLERAAMLSSGVLALLAVRRRRRLRSARARARLPRPAPAAAATERSLRAIGAGDHLLRVVTAIRASARLLVTADERVEAVLVDADGAVEVRVSGPVELSAPWEGAGRTWTVSASTPLELLAEHAGSVPMPSPTLVQLGRSDDGRDVYVDLEGLEAIEVGGPTAQADAVVAATAATLAGSLLAEVTTLVGVDVPDAAFLGHRLHVAAVDVERAFAAAAEAVGSTASQPRSTFELRSRAEAGEAWEPAVVLVGSSAGAVAPPRSRAGLAIVSASPIHGPSSRLAPAGDSWELLPIGIRLTPVGLTGADIAAVADLVRVPDPEPAPEPTRRPDPGVAAITVGVDDDRTLVPPPDDDRDEIPEVATESTGRVDDAAIAHTVADESMAADWALAVRLLGPVEVVSRDGRDVAFERSKTRELVAWLATHRERSTRSAARTALWEHDVRDATFANVVSEARRSLARLVEPAEGEEWVGRTMTEALPLHAGVVTDADLVAAALEAARLQPPDQAIDTLTPAVEWIRGLPFEGTSYLWPDAEGITSQLVLLATTAASELAAHCLSVGDVEGVFRATGRGLQVLPGHEDLIGLRMRAHARFGDLAGVRAEWESYERVINADPWSDGEPSPSLLELRRSLL